MTQTRWDGMVLGFWGLNRTFQLPRAIEIHDDAIEIHDDAIEIHDDEQHASQQSFLF
jgi:hypothetical protein